MPSLALLAPALFVLVVGTAFMSGIFGMAGGIVLMGALTFFLPVRTAMLLHGVTQFASNFWRAFVWRHYIAWRVLLPYFAGSITALALFAWVRYEPEKAWVLLALGIVPFIGFLLPARFAPDVEKPAIGALCGFVIAAIMIVAGVAGPLLDVFFVKSKLDRRAVIATKATTQCVGHTMKLIYFGVVVDMAGGFADLPWWIYAGCIVAAMIGTTLAKGLLERMSDVQFRTWTQRILLVIGTVYLAQGAYKMLEPASPPAQADSR
ncbi:MAG: sulfite exporter TauE/SafE family protein [Alphaproteobacteria bacterium]